MIPKSYPPIQCQDILLHCSFNYKKNMDRKDFLNSIGMSAAAFALLNCIGCKKTDGSSSTDTTGPSGINVPTTGQRFQKMEQ
ncbi:hypothetical protein GJU39_08380 [Pedobacter petrophilus]|uniref:Uncharacterized protein n=1 Tax=Pedobacter petrophilus TaxID=1908241 RepID=A0A7K0FYF2_9SPHI|nr:hypothetical protein [Pedobacter petrophilus]MRX76104.1 hypothetical protein [Pedobacter petrophilus]